MNEVTKLNSHSMESLNNSDSPTIETNDLQLQREKIQQFIKDNFSVLISNVENLDDAQIICLGESHGSEKHRQINAHIIDSLFIEGSLLLVEETRESNENASLLLNEEYRNDQAKYVKKPIKIEGWDIELNEKSGQDLKKFVKAGLIYEKPEVGYFLSSAKVESQVQDLQNDQLSTCGKISTIFSFFCTLCCTALYIKSCRPCIKSYYKKQAQQGLQKIIDEVPVRNQKMCNTLQKLLETHKRVFVIAGSNHFDFVEEGEGAEGIDYAPSNKAVDETYKFLFSKKSAILIPKSDEE